MLLDVTLTLIEAEKPAAFRPLSRTPAQRFYFLDLPLRLFLKKNLNAPRLCFVPSSPRCLPRVS